MDSTTSTPKHHRLNILIGVLIAVAVLLVVFKIGELVGSRKTFFAAHWNQHYQQIFIAPPVGFMGAMNGHGMMAPHGTLGNILSVTNDTLIISGPNKIETSVHVNDDTTIRQHDEDIHIRDIHPNDHVVIFGAPNDDGQIEAKFIRVFSPNEL